MNCLPTLLGGEGLSPDTLLLRNIDESDRV